MTRASGASNVRPRTLPKKFSVPSYSASRFVGRVEEDHIDGFCQLHEAL